MSASTAAETPLVLSGPADVLAALPHLFGYRISGSLVVMVLRGHAATGYARMDLPEPGQLASFVGDLLAAVDRLDGDAVVVVGYSTPTVDATPAVAAAALSLNLCADTCVPWAVLVEGERFTVLASTDPNLLEHRWQPLPPAHDRVCVELIARHGTHPLASRTDLAARVLPTARAAQVRQHRQSLARAPQPPSTGQYATAWAHALSTDPHELPPATLALLADSIEGPAGRWRRDAILTHLCPHTAPTAAERELVADLPTLERSDPHASSLLRDRLISLCAHVGDSVPLLAITAAATWWCGDGTLARVCIDRARDLDPQDTLTGLLEAMISHGIPLPDSRPDTTR